MSLDTCRLGVTRRCDPVWATPSRRPRLGDPVVPAGLGGNPVSFFNRRSGVTTLVTGSGGGFKFHANIPGPFIGQPPNKFLRQYLDIFRQVA